MNYARVALVGLVLASFALNKLAQADVVRIKFQGPTFSGTQEFTCIVPNVYEDGVVLLGDPFTSCGPYLWAGYTQFTETEEAKEIYGLIIIGTFPEDYAVMEMSYEANLPAIEKPLLGGSIYLGVSDGTQVYPADEFSAVWATVDSKIVESTIDLTSLVLPDEDDNPNEAISFIGPRENESLQVPTPPMNQSAGVHWKYEFTPGILTLQFKLKVGELHDPVSPAHRRIEAETDCNAKNSRPDNTPRPNKEENSGTSH